MNQADIKFYQNNPCLIVRDVNELFCEIQLNVHFAANMESEYYCTPSEFRSPMSSHDNGEEQEGIQAIIDDIQKEEHSIICMVEKRLLHDSPIEANTINSLAKEIKRQSAEFEATKDLHEEWQASLKSLKSQAESLRVEISALELSREANENLRKTTKSGLNKMCLRFNKILVDIGKYERGSKQVSMGTYNELENRSCRLAALEKGGVDNWEWYEESLKNAGLISDE